MNLHIVIIDKAYHIVVADDNADLMYQIADLGGRIEDIEIRTSVTSAHELRDLLNVVVDEA